MAKLSVTDGFQVDLSLSSLSSFSTADVSASTKHVFEITVGFFAAELRGESFTYNRDGFLKSGTIKEFTVTSSGSEVYSFSDFTAKTKNFLALVESETVEDDLAFNKLMLGGNDKLHGADQSDTLLGYAGNDKLFGHGGADILSGSSGDDQLNGGLNADSLVGGKGADRFIYSDALDSVVGGSDVIEDFSHFQKDKIDVSKVADFDLIAASDFSGSGDAELRYVDEGATILISGDVDGDGTADFEIHLNTGINLLRSDFIL